MLDFIYDSLDTVKKLKFPTVKQITRLTLAIFALVIVAGAYFILADTIFSGGYKAFYSAMTEGQVVDSWAASTGVIDASVLPTSVVPEVEDLEGLPISDGEVVNQ